VKGIVSKIQALEESGDIPPWDEEHIPDEIVARKPDPGIFCATNLLLALNTRHSYRKLFYLIFQQQKFQGLLKIFELLVAV
jgi:hypothetical protein